MCRLVCPSTLSGQYFLLISSLKSVVATFLHAKYLKTVVSLEGQLYFLMLSHKLQLKLVIFDIVINGKAPVWKV